MAQATTATRAGAHPGPASVDDGTRISRAATA